MDVQVTNPIHAHATNDVKNGKNLINSVKSAAKACLPKAEPRKRPSFNCTSPTVPPHIDIYFPDILEWVDEGLCGMGYV
jgi:hypothetical protein